MYKGNQTHTKLEIIIYMVNLLLLDRRLEPIYIMNKFNITRHTLVRYIATIKNTFSDFGLYHLDIFYDYKYCIYRCIVNE